MGFLPWTPETWDNVFNLKLEAALDKWDPGFNGYGDGRWRKIRAAVVPAGRPNSGSPALDAECLRLIKSEALVENPFRGIGPVFNGGKSVLQHDLTHATSGIALYPAFDDAFSAGTTIIAPEHLKVTRASSANPGDAFYCVGDSGLQYWFGHLVKAPDPGRFFAKGASVGVVAKNNVGGGPHVHVGVNVEMVMGAGKQLIHHTNYTHGAPLVGDQLAAWLLT